jgi:hypothetical protein
LTIILLLNLKLCCNYPDIMIKAKRWSVSHIVDAVLSMESDFNRAQSLHSKPPVQFQQFGAELPDGLYAVPGLPAGQEVDAEVVEVVGEVVWQPLVLQLLGDSVEVVLQQCDEFFNPCQSVGVCAGRSFPVHLEFFLESNAFVFGFLQLLKGEDSNI